MSTRSIHVRQLHSDCSTETRGSKSKKQPELIFNTFVFMPTHKTACVINPDARSSMETCYFVSPTVVTKLFCIIVQIASLTVWVSQLKSYIFCTIVQSLGRLSLSKDVLRSDLSIFPIIHSRFFLMLVSVLQPEGLCFRLARQSHSCYPDNSRNTTRETL